MLPIVVGAIALVCVVLRKWRIAAFVVFALAVESATYRATTLVVHSHRPRVVRLENLPVNASYPSGHTAASLAVYGGLALLLTSRFTNTAFRVVAWTFVLAMVTFVATSRMYRGMHHPLDVAGGVFVGDRRADRRRLRVPHGRRRGRGRAQMKVAVIAHSGKTLGGGLPELRRVLAARRDRRPVLVRGAEEPQGAAAGAPRARRGRELVFAWGGDGMVQRCVDVLAGSQGEPRDHSGGNREPLRDQPRDPQGHRGGRRDRASRRAPQARRRPLQRRAVRGDGGRRLRRGDDPRAQTAA